MSSVKTNMSNKQTNKYKQKQAAAWGQLKLTKQTNKQTNKELPLVSSNKHKQQRNKQM